ncbi:hypothetical protein LTR22_002413 [Elasticomyces elasticus]|nr:hypothetical protein LTR22_002413 [Elasticomyces elasticus]KAK4918850.1 hypothetical protein LTR49_013481 [Elasticomyces elasticus]KAK5758767.1 hypothetical protein LTS12_011161 [Elasticomyces elasticus]
MAQINWRTINIDALDPDSSTNFDLSSLTPHIEAVSTSEIQQVGGQIRQLLRGGNAEGALQAALENVPYGGAADGKAQHATVVSECLNSIRATEMSPLLSRLYSSQNGSELCDTLMKYLYKGMAQGAVSKPAAGGNSHGARNVSGAGGFTQAGGRNFGSSEAGGGMSVFLSWMEKLVEMVGPGSIVRVMSDRRTV